MTKTEPTVAHSTFVLERSYPAPPERVYAAFADPAKKRRWFFESSHTELMEHQMDFRVGGEEQARYRFKPGMPVAGLVCINDARYQDIVPDRRVVFAQSMNIGGKLISAALVTVEFLPSDAGTELVCTHQGAFFEGADGPQIREQGWRTLFEKLHAELAS